MHKQLLIAAMKERYGFINLVDYDESEKKAYLRFLVNSDLHLAEMVKDSKLIKHYVMKGSVIENDNDN